MSHFSSNLSRPSRSRVLRGPGAASGGQPLVSSSSPVVVPTPIAAVNRPPNVAGSLIPAPGHDHGANKDPITLVEPYESAPLVDKGKQLVDKGSHRKRK